MSSDKKRKTWIWLIPLLAIIFTVAFFALTRYMVGEQDAQDIDYFTIPFVPGESPHSSSGEDSR